MGADLTIDQSPAVMGGRASFLTLCRWLEGFLGRKKPKCDLFLNPQPHFEKIDYGYPFTNAYMPSYQPKFGLRYIALSFVDLVIPFFRDFIGSDARRAF